MFLPGQSSITIPITTIADGVAEGIETIVLSIHSVNSCSGFTQDQVISLTIDDNVPPLVITGNNPTICYNTSATITPIITGGFGQYTYLWNTGATSQTLSSTYTTTTTVTLTVSDVCNTAPVTQSFTITVQPPIADLISTSQPAQFTLNCLGSQNVMATANAGAAITSVQWFWNGQPQTSTGYSMMISSSMGPGIATIVAVNSCNQADSISFESIIYNEPLVLNLPDTIFGSCSALSAVSPTYTGGEGTVNFAWFNLSTGSSLGSTQSVLFSDNTEQSLLLVGVDQCGSVDSSTTLFYLPPNPLIAYMPSDTTICYGQSLVLSPDLSGGDLPYIYRWSTTALNPTITAHPLGDTLYYVVVTDACNRTDSLSIDVTVDVIDGIINVIEASNSSYLFTPVVQSTSDYTTFWDFGDGTSSNDRAPLHEYSTESEYLITLDMATLNGCTASAQITVKPGAFLYIPNAFTPDGDGVNDAFQISVTAAKSGSITIYNRWGQIVFETTDLNATWVGNYQPGEYYFVPDDVYNYEVVVESITGDVIKKRGTITILR
jgi:gliding motility-associated-like protein